VQNAPLVRAARHRFRRLTPHEFLARPSGWVSRSRFWRRKRGFTTLTNRR